MADQMKGIREVQPRAPQIERTGHGYRILDVHIGQAGKSAKRVLNFVGLKAV